MQEKFQIYRKFVFWVLVASVLFLLFVGTIFLVSTVTLLKSGEITEGTVVEVLKEHDRSSNGTIYRPVFEFQTPDGSTHKFASSMASNPQSYFEGDKERIIYRPDNPRSASIYSFMSLWLIPIGFYAAAIINSAFWGVLLLTVFRKPKTTPLDTPQ